MKDFFIQKDWFDFNALPGSGELDAGINLPPMDDLMYEQLQRLAKLREEDEIANHICRLTILIIDRIDSLQYTLVEAESVFCYICQIARFNGLYLEEYSKRDEILHMVYQICSVLTSFLDNDPADTDTTELKCLVETVIDREKQIQMMSAGCVDFRTQNIFLAKLIRDVRLQGYLLDALRFYETVPQDEIFEDREFYIDNILEALGNPRWDEFVPILEKYLYYKDDVIPFTAMDSLGIIGGQWAPRALKRYLRQVLEGFIDIGEYEHIALDMNIIAAEKGYMGLILEIIRPGAELLKSQVAIRFLSAFKKPEVVKFLFRLLNDERFEEMDVYYVSETEDFVQKEIRFPLREEALTILESYDENFVVSVVGEKYLLKRDYFYQDLMKLYQKKGIEKFWDDEDFPGNI